MKKIVILTLAILSSVVGFSQKIGHIDRVALISAMPETATVETKLQGIQKEYEDALQAMYAEYQKLGEEYQNNSATWPNAIRESKLKAIQNKEAEIQEFQQTASNDVQVQQEQLYRPIVDKAEKAIADVAKENGFTYIIDSGLGVLLYIGGEDIMDKVKIKLNIPLTPATPAPATPAPGTTPQK